ncbi:hypothetical protein YC2023_122127 [Brassica napus]
MPVRLEQKDNVDALVQKGWAFGYMFGFVSDIQNKVIEPIRKQELRMYFK